MANDAPPGASATAISTAAAIGRGVNFGNMLEAPSEGACVREGLLNSLLGS
jgi:endoglucanase